VDGLAAASQAGEKPVLIAGFRRFGRQDCFQAGRTTRERDASPLEKRHFLSVPKNEPKSLFWKKRSDFGKPSKDPCQTFATAGGWWHSTLAYQGSVSGRGRVFELGSGRGFQSPTFSRRPVSLG
jgi:hypothetical protein